MPKKTARRRKKSSLIKNLKWLSRDRLPTIISIAVLLVGLAAGVALVQRQQEIREKAALPPRPCRVCLGIKECKKIKDPPYCNTGDNECFVDQDCIVPTPTPSCVADGQCTGPGDLCCSRNDYFDASCFVTEARCGTPKPTPTKKPTPTPPPDYCTNRCCNVGANYPGCWVNHYWSWDASDPVVNDIAICEGCQKACFAKDCGAEQIDVGCSTNGGSKTVQFIWIRYGGDCQPSPPPPTNTPTPTKTPTPTPTKTPTPTPPATAQCKEIKAYDTNWNLLSINDLEKLGSGKRVRFTVLGSTTAGIFDKAIFSINGAFTPEVTQKKPGTQKFYYEYTITVGDAGKALTVSGWIHHAGIDQWF